jgi:hypothetical protein
LEPDSGPRGWRIVIMIGVEPNAKVKYQTARDSTVGSEKPLGGRAR